MQRSLRFGMRLGFILLLSACGGKGGNSGGPIARIEINPPQASLAPGQTVQFSAVAKTSSGDTVGNVPFSWHSADPTIATVDPNGFAVGVKFGVTSVAATTGTFQGSAPVGVVNPAPGGSNITVSGTAEYEDKEFNLNGFTGNRPHAPIRGAIINLIAIDGFVTLASGATGADGTFTFSGINNGSRRGGLYLQVVSKTNPTNPAQVEIRNNPADRSVFGVRSQPLLDDGSRGSFPNTPVLAAASGIGGAFNSLDIFTKANELVQSAGACNKVQNPSPAPCIPPPLTAYWEPGSAEGTFFDPQQDAIFILGGGTADGDTDEYDDSVIAHEYGHFVIAHFSHDNSPGGQHFITDNAQDIRLSFSEGWGNFFSSAVRNNPLYVDTAAQGAFSFELEGLTSPQSASLPSLAVYDTHELSNAKVMWDLFDSRPGDDDPLALGFGPVWQTMLQLPAALPATMESFWLAFAKLNPSSTNPFADGLQTILKNRQIEFFPDGAPSPLNVNGATQHHTLYRSGPDPAGDEDVIPLNGLLPNTQYTIETSNLTNAADTLLTVTDGSGAPIPGLQNDNRDGKNYQNCDTAPALGDTGPSGSNCPPNTKTTLSSAVTFKTGSATALSAHVKRSPSAPPSAGMFGSYDIHLKGP